MGQIKNIKLHIVTDIKGHWIILNMDANYQLPYEIWNKIAWYCSHEDIKRLTTCSRAFYNVFKELIWQEVQLEFPKSNLNQDKEYLRNLRHTKSLVFILSWC